MNTQQQTLCFIGVDVASREVVVAGPGEGAVRTLANEKAALARWLATLPPNSRLGLESTGGYHLPLAGLAHAGGFTVYVLNPRDVRHYAKALGRAARRLIGWMRS